MNKNLQILMITAFMVSGLSLADVQAATQTIFGDYLKDHDIDVSVSATVDFYDKYVWRGFLLDDSPSLQPGLEVGVGGLTFGAWGSWDVVQDDALNGDEFDSYVSYSFSPGEKLSLSIGNTYYTFPGSDLYTSELFLGLEMDTFLSPSFTYYYDYGKEDQGGAQGSYYVMSISHSIDLVKDYGMSLDLGTEVGINDAFFIEGNGGYSLTSLGFSVPLTDSLTMSPSIAYSVPFGDLSGEGDGNQNEQFYGGFSLSASF